MKTVPVVHKLMSGLKVNMTWCGMRIEGYETLWTLFDERTTCRKCIAALARFEQNRVAEQERRLGT